MTKPKKNTLQNVPREAIEIEGNVRKRYTGIKDLAESIDKLGLISPLFLRQAATEEGEKVFYVIAGHRRLAAIDLLRERSATLQLPHKFDRVPAIVTRATQRDEILLTQMAENTGRSELRQWEVGAGIEELLQLGLTPIDIAERLAKSRVWVHNQVRYHRRLHTDVKRRLGTLHPELVTVRLLERLAKKVSKDSKGREKPDKQAQMSELEKLAQKSTHSRPFNHTSVKRKIGRLRADLLPQLTGQAHSTLSAALEFLEGAGEFESIPT